MKVTAQATRSGDWWAVEVPEVKGVFTQVKRLEQAPSMVRDAVSLMTDVAPEEVEVSVVPSLDDGDVGALLDSLREANRVAQEAQRQACSQARDLVRRLRVDYQLPVRDVAVLLDISHQRVSQLSH